MLFCLFHRLDVTKSGEDLQTAQPDSEGQLPQEGTGEGTETAQGAEAGQDQTEGQLDSDRCADMTYSCPVCGSETHIKPPPFFWSFFTIQWSLGVRRQARYILSHLPLQIVIALNIQKRVTALLKNMCYAMHFYTVVL